MLKFIQDLLTLLVTPPGMLLFHLAIVVSIMAALQATLLHQRNGRFSRRLLVGLLILLAAQIAIFIYAGIHWHNSSPPHTILPILDRTITLLSLVWLIWLWAVPETSTPGDFAHGTLNLVVVLMMLSSLMIWNQMPLDMPFNSSWLDWSWQALSGVIALSGLVAISILRPPRWGVAAASMIVFILGSIAHLIWKDPTADLPALVRLTQLIIYPMLPVLAFRHDKSMPVAAPAPMPAPNHGERGINIAPRAINSWLLALTAPENSRASAVTRAISHTIPADLCFVVEPPNAEGVIAFSSGYDLLQDESIPLTNIHQDQLPGVVNAIMRGQLLMLPTQSEESDDQAALADQLGLEHCGSLLFIPNHSGASLVSGILLVSPYANTRWSSEEQLFLMDQVDLILPLVQGGKKTAGDSEREKALLDVDALKLQQEQLQNQYDQSMEMLEATASTVDQDSGADLASLLLIQDELQHSLAALRSENGRLQTLLAGQPEGELKLNYAHMEHELHQSLAENASLKNMLASANMKIMTLEMQLNQIADLGAFGEILPGLVSTVQELRQPMTSLRGHTELLLNDSAGKLQPLQRKYLERIRASVEKLHHQLELVIRLASMQRSHVSVNPSFFRITDLVDEAIDSTRSQLAEREIALEVTLSQNLPELKLDREAILQVLVQLIQNAGGATPPQGEIKLVIEQVTQLGESVITIQVSDQGRIVPEKLRERVFLGRYRADEALVDGLGDHGLGLFVVRSLVEAHGGTVSYMAGEHGNVITVLLPLEAVLAAASETE